MSHEIGVSDVTRRLVDFADALKWYDVDRYDIVAMKTLLLLSPGSLITVVLSLCTGCECQIAGISSLTSHWMAFLVDINVPFSALTFLLMTGVASSL